MYCSTTGSPDVVSVIALATTCTPLRAPCTPTVAARDKSVIPGTIGWWKRKSCSPCTTVISSSPGTTLTIDGPRTSKTGTTAKTGGATSPPRGLGCSSLVASAYAIVRSLVTSNSLGSPYSPRLSSFHCGWVSVLIGRSPCAGPRSPTSGPAVRRVRGRSRELLQLGQGLLQLLAGGLGDHVGHGALQAAAVEAALVADRRAVARRRDGDRARQGRAHRAGAAHHEPRPVELLDGPRHVGRHADDLDLLHEARALLGRSRRLALRPAVVDRQPLAEAARVRGERERPILGPGHVD